MKIKIDVPDWANDGRTIRILAGIEEVAKRLKDGTWMIKVSRCVRCGKCCMNVPKEWPRGEKDGNCKHLQFYANEYLCDLGSHRPFSCCTGDGWEEECSMEWEKV